MRKQITAFYNYLLQFGFSTETTKALHLVFLVIGLVLMLYIIYFFSRKLIIYFFTKLSKRSKSYFDDLLVSNKVPRNLSHIIPLLIALKVTPDIFIYYDRLEDLVMRGFELFGIILALIIIRSVLNTLKDYLKTLTNFKDKPVDSYIQVFMIFAWTAGILGAFVLITKSPAWNFFAALGTTSAVLLLIFKDTIMGFVASIQISVNDMVRIGDWITFEKYGADGHVDEINLATVKVINFDNTITTIPTYSLISDSFKNWRGMTKSQGRRIKRALIIKQSSIHFLEPSEIEQFKEIELINGYITRKEEAINKYNNTNNIDKKVLLNGRNLTNIGVFRKYLDEYISNHSAINKDLLLMVRQLDPTSQGIPIEIYAFSSDKDWKNYEYIVADIFDHALASTPFFNLEIFELPSHIN